MRKEQDNVFVNIPTLPFIKSTINYLEGENKITQKVYRVGKKVLDCLVHNKHGIAIAIWSYLIIEVGTVAIETNRESDQIYDLTSCQEMLCHYWNNDSNVAQTGTMSHSFEDKCLSFKKQNEPYSFMQCLGELCNYIHSIGEKFYACSGDSKGDNLTSIESEESSTVWGLWKKACPIRHFKNFRNLKQLNYINRCIKKICAAGDQFSSDMEYLELCKTKSIDELSKLLKTINRSVVKLKRVAAPDSFATTNAISGIIAALSGIVNGAAGLATLFLTYRATKVAHTVISKTIPTIQQGVESITRSTVDTTLATIFESSSNMVDLIPMQSLNIMKELTETLENQSIYYSFDKIPTGNGSPQNSMNGAPGTGVVAGAGSRGEAAAVVVLGGVSIVSSGKTGGSGIVIDQFATTKDVITAVIKKVTNTLAPFSEKNKDFSKIIDANYFYDDYSVTINTYNTYDSMKEAIDSLKKELPDWNHSFCFYQKSIDFFACRLPSLRHQLEKVISFSVPEIHIFFSKNISALCHLFAEDLWCNWNRFLNSIFSNRTIGFFNDEDCPWDQFALTIYETANNSYTMQARGQCYNETEWIKI